MDIQKYIASGVLELYVSGALSPEENSEVQRLAHEHPEIQKEIEAIEKTILELTRATSPGLKDNSFEMVKNSIEDVISLNPTTEKKRTPWFSYVGWAASLLLAAGMLWMYVQNEKLKTEIEITEQERQTLQEQISKAREALAAQGETKELLNQLRNKDITVITLGGQQVAPETYAKVYWNEKQQKVFIDAQGLPEPPSGFTYQVWSLKLNPLAPTSIGLLDDFASNQTAVFELDNPNTSEAFGITLEPEGGSESPNLDQLYTLGTVGP